MSNGLGFDCKTLVALLRDRQADSTICRQGHHGILPLPNDKHIAQTCGERMPSCVLDVDNVERTRMMLAMPNDTDTTYVTTSSHHTKIAWLELDEISDLPSLKIQYNRVMYLDVRVRISIRSCIVSDNKWNALWPGGLLGYLAKL